MTIARAHLVDPAVTRWYHCVTRCVRWASLLGEGASDRQAWIDNRLQELAGIFSIAVGGFSVMDNHLHVLVRLDPEAAARWRDEIDFTGRVFREGKAAISREVAEIFQRIGTNADSWQMRLQKLRAGRLLGRFFAASRQRLREIVDRLGLRRAVNLGSCLVA